MGRISRIFLLACIVFQAFVGVASAQEQATYTVQEGDTIATVAERHQVSPDSLIILNRLGPFPLKTGQVLMLPQAGQQEVALNVATLPDVSHTAVGKDVTCVEVADGAEVRVNGNAVLRIRGNLAGRTPMDRAKIVAARLAGVGSSFNPDEIMPVYENGIWCVAAHGVHIINIDDESVRANGLSEGELAFAWANNIRRSFGVDTVMLDSIAQETKASFYWQGSHTASGEAFNPDGITAAHRTLPFGTLVLVSDLETKKSIIVRINDRGPFIDGRQIDLSRGAAAKINRLSKGVLDVKMHVLRFDRD